MYYFVASLDMGGEVGGGVIIKIIGQQECKLYLPNLRLLHFMLDKTLTTQVKTNTPQLVIEFLSC